MTALYALCGVCQYLSPLTELVFCRSIWAMTKTSSPPVLIEFHLKQIVEERHLSILDVSRMTGLSRYGIYMMLERLPRAIKFETIARLCIGLDIMPADLFVIRRPRIK